MAMTRVANQTIRRGLAGAAALAAWRRDGVTVPPGEFLDVAESSGVVVALGDWMLGEACRQTAQWAADGLQIGISVNVSARFIARANLPS